MALSCLGLSVLGLCEYDPAKPAVIYFTLGDVAAALSVTLLIHQFLKPIYEFRLWARRLSVQKLYISIFLGAVAAFTAALLPHLPLDRSTVVAYPVFWELVAAVLFGLAYAVLAYASVRPALLRAGEYSRFIQGAADFLAKADERGQVDFAFELSRNIGPLVRSASFLEQHKERSAFFDFSHRRQIDDASYAASFLHILSDPHFCHTAVSRCPWQVARLIGVLTDEYLVSGHARKFVQELARQAIISRESMMTREIGYVGFRAAPVLSTALFGSSFINRNYEPFDGLRYEDFREPSRELTQRFNAAAKLTVETTLRTEDYWYGVNYFHLEHAYEWIFMKLRGTKRDSGKEPDFGFEVSLGVRDIVRMTRDHLHSLTPSDRLPLYAQLGNNADNNVFEAISDIVCKSLSAVADNFSGPGDSYWLYAREIFGNVFPSSSNAPIGMDPLQQRVALKIIEQVSENVTGVYPALSRVLLSIFGPYGSHGNAPTGSAFDLLETAVYNELKQLPQLAKDPKAKIGDFLPDNVRYDAAKDELVHTYVGGTERRTHLAGLSLPQVTFASSDVAL